MSIEHGGGYENHIDRINILRLGVIDEKEKEHIAEVYGAWLLKPATYNQRKFAYSYLKGPLKPVVGRVLCRLGWALAGRSLADYFARIIEKIDPRASGYFDLPVGFVPGGQITNMRKIRTMEPGAHNKRKDRFVSTTIVAGVEDIADERILDHWFVHLLRRLGGDEITQIGEVAEGKMMFVGLRPLTDEELEDIKLLEEGMNDPRLNFAPEVREEMIKYRGLVYLYNSSLPKLKPAIISLLSGLDSKNTRYAVRILLGRTYLEIANPYLDFLATVRTIQRRIIKGVGAR